MNPNHRFYNFFPNPSPDPGITEIPDWMPTPGPAGYYCSDIHSTAIGCLVGQFCPQDSKQPLSCPIGTYQDQPNQAECIDCPGGYYCPDRTTSPTICPVGHGCANLSTTPTECVKGEYQLGWPRQEIRTLPEICLARLIGRPFALS